MYVLIPKVVLKRSQKVKSVPKETSVKLSSKSEATFISDLLFQRLVVLANGCNIDCKMLTIVKDINSEYIPQHYLNQQLK